MRLAGLRFGLPHGLARPDEERITSAALGMLQGDLNPHFFLYPSLFIYLTAAGYALQFVVERAIGSGSTLSHFVAAATADPTLVHLVPRGLAAAAGVATIVALYAAGRELFSTRAALASSAFLAVAFLHVRDSHFGVTDVPVTLVAVCAFWAAARCFTLGPSLLRVSGTGLLCGLAASTKYTAALVALPAVVAIVDASQRSHRGYVATLRACVVLGACLVAGFLLGTPFALLDRPAFSRISSRSGGARWDWPAGFHSLARQPGVWGAGLDSPCGVQPAVWPGSAAADCRPRRRRLAGDQAAASGPFCAVVPHRLLRSAGREPAGVSAVGRSDRALPVSDSWRARRSSGGGDRRRLHGLASACRLHDAPRGGDRRTDRSHVDCVRSPHFQNRQPRARCAMG